MVEFGQLIPADQIASELAGLGRSGTSGAVEIDGQPRGIVYLRHGRLTFAASPAVPDLGTRLIRSRRLLPDVWDQIARDHRTDGGVGAALVGRGLVTQAELQRLVQSIALDALLALTAPFAGECAVTGIWLAPQRSHWAETLLAMDVASVRRYIDHMTQQLAWYDVNPRWCPQWSAHAHPTALVNSGQRAIASLIDGRTTVRELAWRGGLSLHETMESVGQLLHAGMCTRPERPARPELPAGPERPEQSERPQPAALPRRDQPTAARVTTQARATPLEFGLLQRVRQGLERMA